MPTEPTATTVEILLYAFLRDDAGQPVGKGGLRVLAKHTPDGWVADVSRPGLDGQIEGVALPEIEAVAQQVVASLF